MAKTYIKYFFLSFVVISILAPIQFYVITGETVWDSSFKFQYKLAIMPLIAVTIFGFMLSRIIILKEKIRSNEKTLERKVKERTLELELMRDDALGAVKAKNYFIRAMSHEFRTPLNHILGYTHLLKEEIEDEGNTQSVSDLDKIQQSGEKLLEMIQDILFVSDLNSGSVALNIEPINLAQCISEMIVELSDDIQNQGNKLLLSEMDPMTVYLDKIIFQKALFHIIAKANKMTENGLISVTSNINNEKINVRISDTSQGMKSEDIKNAFSPFRQGDKEVHDGLGIDLNMCCQICKIMKGSINVTSQLGVGTEFHILLPVDLRK